MNNKAIIEFGFRIIGRIVEISDGCYPRPPTASTDNTVLDFHNRPYARMFSYIQDDLNTDGYDRR